MWMQVVVFSGLAGPFLGDGVRISVIWEGVRDLALDKQEMIRLKLLHE